MKRTTVSTDIIREYILGLLESGALKEGDVLPPARKIAEDKGISFIKVQQGIDTLKYDGILETAPRQGTFVKRNWAANPLRGSLSIRPMENEAGPGLRRILSEEIPELRINKGELKGVFDVEVTLETQARHEELMDLSGIFLELFPDRSLFYEEPFKCFYKGDKLFAIPLIFSPRVMFYNADMLSKAGCRLPEKGWIWDDFMESVRKLKRIYRPESVFPVYKRFATSIWMTFVFRAGGGFLDRDGNVILDSPASRKGIRLYKELVDELGFSEYAEKFSGGNLALSLAYRQKMMCPLKNAAFKWGVVPPPVIESGNNLTVQATEAFSVRRGYSDSKLIKKAVKVLLSERVQNYLGSIKHGIPVRKSSAMRSLDKNDTRDKIFFDETLNMTGAYCVENPSILKYLDSGVNSVIQKRDGEFESSLSSLANFFRVYLSLEKNDLGQEK